MSLRVGGGGVIAERGLHQLRKVPQQRFQFGTDSDRDGVVVVPQRRARLHHEALQIEPGAATGQGHDLLGQFDQFAPFVAHGQGLNLLAQVARRSLQDSGIGRATQLAPA